MNREWLTLAFGILLVLTVVVVSVRHNVPWLNQQEESPADDRTADSPSDPPPRGTPSSADPSAAPSKPGTQPDVVRLDASVPVVHKHRLGSCEGTLRATSNGLTYATPDRDDAFRLAFGEVDQFELVQDRRNLRVRQRGGRTWNFTGRGENPAGLIAFHRQVERTRRAGR
jgi:hypothetical protein